MIPLLFALFFIPQDKPAEHATLSGTVTDSVTRQPISRATVIAEPVGRGPAASTVTDAAGRFELVALEPGQYHVKGRRNGYQDTYHGARRAENRGTAISLDPAQQWKDLEIKLLPYAVIAGTVRDTDGEPIVGANVYIFSMKYSQGVRMLSTEAGRETDDLGQYRAIVPPGRYYVLAEPDDDDDALESVDHSPATAKPRERLLPMFFPNAPDTTGARVLSVDAGARLPAVDITLPRSRVFRVKVHVDTPNGLPAHASIQAARDVDRDIRLPAVNKGNGDFEFRNVPPGSYAVVASAILPAEAITNSRELFFAGNRAYRTRVPLDVGNSDVDGIRIAIAPGSEVTTRMTVEGEAAPPPANMSVRFQTRDSRSEYWMKGAHTIQSSLSPDRYEVYVVGDPRFVTTSLRAGATDVIADGLTVDGQSKILLEVTLTTAAGRLDGVVFDKDEKPVAGATVVLVPEPSRRNRWDLFRTAATDQYGRFEMQTLTPGEYKVFAWDDVESGSWFDPEVLKAVEAQGTAVTVEAKTAGTAKVRLVN